jgi:hypothetical protein
MMYYFIESAPKFMDYPAVNVVSNENETIELDIDWQNSVMLNDELRQYELYLNNQSVYIGKSTNLVYRLNASLFDCRSRELSANNSSSLVRKNGFSKNAAGFFEISIELRVRTVKSNLTTRVLKIPFDCPCIFQNHIAHKIISYFNARHFFLLLSQSV